MCQRTHFRDHRGEDTSFAILWRSTHDNLSVVVPWSEADAQNVVVLSEGQTIAWILRMPVLKNSTDWLEPWMLTSARVLGQIHIDIEFPSCCMICTSYDVENGRMLRVLVISSILDCNACSMCYSCQLRTSKDFAKTSRQPDFFGQDWWQIRTWTVSKMVFSSYSDDFFFFLLVRKNFGLKKSEK